MILSPIRSTNNYEENAVRKIVISYIIPRLLYDLGAMIVSKTEILRELTKIPCSVVTPGLEGSRLIGISAIWASAG